MNISTRARRRAVDLAAPLVDLIVLPVGAGWVANHYGGPVVGVVALLAVFALGALSDQVRRGNPRARRWLAAAVRVIPGELGPCRECGEPRRQHYRPEGACPGTECDDGHPLERYLPMWLVKS